MFEGPRPRNRPGQTFLATFNAFGVAMQARRASQMMKDHGIDGVPTMAVQRSCEVSGDLAQTATDERFLQAVDELVDWVHARQASAR